MDSQYKKNILISIITSAVTLAAFAAASTYLPEGYAEGIVAVAMIIGGIYFHRKTSLNRRKQHEREASKQLSYRNDSDIDLIERSLHLSENNPELQRAIKDELAGRGGLEYEIAQRQDSIRRKQFPGFVAGVLTFTLFPLVLGMITRGGAKNSIMLFGIMLAFAIIFLSTFDSTMKSKHWIRSLSIVGLLVFIQVVAKGSFELDETSLLVGILLLFTGVFVFWGIGRMGATSFTRMFV